MTQTSADPMPRAPAWACAVLLALLAPLAACSSGADRVITGSTTPNDYRQRHPVALVEQPRTLELFIAGRTGELDMRTIDQLHQFAANARASAVAPINLLLPRGSGHDLMARAALPGIERALTEGGARGYVNVGTYPVPEPGLAAPIRLSVDVI